MSSGAKLGSLKKAWTQFGCLMKKINLKALPIKHSISPHVDVSLNAMSVTKVDKSQVRFL